MSRKPKYKRKLVKPDRIYNNKLISKFINFVMLDGKIVEQGPVGQIFNNPQHDYTKKLINAVPKIGSMTGKKNPEKFPVEY